MDDVHARDGEGGDVDVVRRPRAALPGRCDALLELAQVGDRPRDVDRVERQPADGRGDAVERADLRNLGRGHAQLRAAGERVARELLTGLAELVEPDARAAVLRAELLPLLLRELAERAGPGAEVEVEVERPRDGEVGADAGERLEHLLLGVVDPTREGRDGDDEADADGEAEGGQERAAGPAPELREGVREGEHAAEPTSRS